MIEARARRARRAPPSSRASIVAVPIVARLNHGARPWRGGRRRQAVVLETLEDVRACLGRVARDPDVRLVRLRNGFAAGWDARPSAGLRVLAVSLRLACGTARRLGVDRHVVELQLRLAAVDRLRGPAQHARHLAYKDVMAGGR
jgi:hypothetical protein